MGANEWMAVMSRGYSKSPKSSLTNRTVDSCFFYDNLKFQQALATLRFGIEARKGLILLTGETGVGKTTLLHKLTSKLDANVTCIWVGDPSCDLAEIVRLILHHLGIEASADGESAMTERCLEILRSRLENNLIVALIFDNAHHLGNRILEPVIKNLLKDPARSSEKTLLQIVLSGRPELRDKLRQPEFRTTGFPVGIEYELPMLTEDDIYHYVEQRLRFGGLSTELFSRAAVQLIAAHSRGRAQLVNAMCDRALETAFDLSRTPISAEIIAGAIEDLDLRQPESIRKEEPETNFVPRRERDIPYYLNSDDDTTTVVGQTFLHYNNSSDHTKRFYDRGWFLMLVMVLFVLGAAHSLNQFEPAKRLASDWSEAAREIAGLNRPNPMQANGVAELPLAIERATDSLPPPRETKSLSTNSDNNEATEPPMSEMEDSVEPTPSATPKTLRSDRAKPPSQTPLKTRPSLPNSAKVDSEATSREQAIKISKAIEDRAILGIGVAVIDHVAYLDGRVASEAQRRVVERAARDVPQIRAVRNRIVVD